MVFAQGHDETLHSLFSSGIILSDPIISIILHVAVVRTCYFHLSYDSVPLPQVQDEIPVAICRILLASIRLNNSQVSNVMIFAWKPRFQRVWS